MWKVYSDSYLIYAESLDDYKIFDTSLQLELNKTGTFDFTIYPNHPNYNRLDKLKSIIEVYKDDVLYFRGRILNDELGFYNERKVSCEGELSFLIDSIQRPFSFPAEEDDPATPEEYLRFLITKHNAQVPSNHQFTVGTVTVTDSNNRVVRSDTEYENTWDLINNGLLDTHGGYLWVRHSNGTTYLDYLADFDVLGNQPIEFGKNLLDVSIERNGEDIATAIVPLGATDEETDEVLTISDLPDETTSDVCKSGDMVYSIAAETMYGGRITKVVKFEDVTLASNLLTRAKAELSKSIQQEQTTDFSAADLSAAGYNFDSFHIGTKIQANSTPHNIEGVYLVKKLNIDFQNPSSNKVSIGSTIFTFTEKNKRDREVVLKEVKTNIEKNNTRIVQELEERTDSVITQTSESILSRVSDEYYTKDETDTKVSELSTEIEQTADAVEIRFTDVSTDINELQTDVGNGFAEIKSFIRLENGNVIIGLSDNSFKQVQSATKNSFFDDAVEVAYFSNKKLYITDGEFTNSLKIGKFAFIPRSNGNTSFKKVED